MNSSTSLPEPTLLPRQSAPLTVITPTDQGGIVIIATALALVFALLFVILRLFVRAEFRHSYSRDDIAALVSMLFMAVQTGLVFSEVSHGFGKTGGDVSAANLVAWEKYAYASDIFYILTLWSTKISIVLLFLRLSPDKMHNLVSHVFMGVSGVLMTISIFVVSLRCRVSEPWLFVGVICPGLTVVAFDIFSEVILFLISIYIVQGLQLALGKKMVVVFAFGLRLLVIAPAALRVYYQGIEIGSTDPSLDGVLATVCAEIELCYAVVATTIPCLRPFMFALSTNYGGPTHVRTSPGNTTKRREGYNISMGPMSNNTSKIDKVEKEDPPAPTTRWDGAGYNVNVVTGDHESVTSNDSRRMIISKNTEWVVDYENLRKDS